MCVGACRRVCMCMFAYVVPVWCVCVYVCMCRLVCVGDRVWVRVWVRVRVGACVVHVCVRVSMLSRV